MQLLARVEAQQGELRAIEIQVIISPLKKTMFSHRLKMVTERLVTPQTQRGVSTHLVQCH